MKEINIMPGGEGCPPCDIIILSYAGVAANSLYISKQAEAIDELYGTSFVQARIVKHPDIHADNMEKLQHILDQQAEQKATLNEIIRSLSPQSPQL